MRTVIITDAKYRASVAAVRTLGRAGYRVVVTQTRADCPWTPPAFASRYVAERHWLPGAAADGNYSEYLLALLERYDKPALFCTGAATLNVVSWQRERFRTLCRFLIASPGALNALNDKEAVHRRCLELHIPVPLEYDGKPERYPVVVKPHCGEKFGLKARERYQIARNEKEWRTAVSAMSAYDNAPLVQEYVQGDGMGASLLMGRDGVLLGALCHRRIREYPISGGPSACCESVYDDALVQQAHKLLRSFGFQGLAMVEFKGGRVLEVNPRIWGSFPLTEKARSPLPLRYVQAAYGAPSPYVPHDYRNGVRMRFLLNDSAALLSLLRHGHVRAFLRGLPDCLFAQEALSSWRDPAPMLRYLRNTLFTRRG
ncbi:MAG: ATP-grasp domain-containing protein [Oscillibacter sp.]|nr:ATP-grasp domain-containing protein [Oscillibacter sp.]